MQIGARRIIWPTRPALGVAGRAGMLRVAGRLMDGVGAASRALPPRARYALADLVSAPIAPLFTARRPIITANMAMVIGKEDMERARRLARESVRNYGRMGMDFLAVRAMPDTAVLSWVTVRHLEHFTAARAEGKGIILALPHLGSWDVGAAFAMAYGCALTVVTEDDWAAKLVAGSRLGRGLTVAPRGSAARALLRALAADGCVAILCDAPPPGVQTALVPFFGASAPFPVGPARLAQRTGAPILVVGSVRGPDHRYTLTLLPPIYVDRALGAEQGVLAATAAIAAGFERLIAASPAQWYPFRAVWPDRA